MSWIVHDTDIRLQIVALLELPVADPGGGQGGHGPPPPAL